MILMSCSARPVVTRGPALSLDQWMRHVEEDGSVSNVDTLLLDIFRGVSARQFYEI